MSLPLKRRSLITGAAASAAYSRIKSAGAFPPSAHGLPPSPPANFITVPLSAEISTYMDGTTMGFATSEYWASTQAHWAGFISALGRTPSILSNVVMGNQYNSADPSAIIDPSSWPSTISEQCGVINSNISPIPAAISIAWVWMNNSGTNLYTDMAGTTSTLYGGQLISYWVQQGLATCKANGFLNLYLRPIWEWNINASWSVGIATVGTAVFVQAFQNFYTLCHAYAAANGMTVHVCWDPSISGQADVNGFTIASQFPNQNPGDNFVDIVCCDIYAETGVLPSYSSTNPSVWTLPAIVALAQKWNLPFGICELGGLAYPNGGGSSASVWIPDMIEYVTSLKGNPPMAFASLYDIYTGIGDTANVEFTAPGAGQAAVLAAWKAGLGPGGTMTTLPANVPPPTCSSRLDFSQSCNSQYLGIVM